MTTAQSARGQWGSKLGFILAASGSAVGLGNIWKFPYSTSENGGGWFVIIYLLCVAVVGLPVMIGEVMIGRAAQRSTVQAYERLSDHKLMWSVVGWMGVIAGFIILSYYSVVAGWAFDYLKFAITDAFGGGIQEMSGQFDALAGSFGRSVLWHGLFMILTIGIVLGGVDKGIERGARILMPALFLMLIGMVVYSMTQKGFGDALHFIFDPKGEELSGKAVLEGVGQAFFSLSLGMGALITYGSYLRRDDDIVTTSASICGLDTAVALMACLVMFPVIFSAGAEAGDLSGPGLVFKTMPVAVTQMTGGYALGVVFFLLLLFAALTSAISLLEVVVSTVIDKFGWSRTAATLVLGAAVFLFGLGSADASFAPFPEGLVGGRNFFGSIDYLAQNIMLPLGGLAISLFVGWVMPASQSRQEFVSGSKLAGLYPGWLILIRFVVPIAILIVFAYSINPSWFK